MSERLTKWEVDGCASVNGCSHIDADMAKAINRLCDLEDKIEKGLLVELPCRVGQKVYVLSRYYGAEWKVYECRVYEYTIYEHNIFMRITNSDYNFGASVREIGVSVFLTKEAAEAKVREMEGERE